MTGSRKFTALKALLADASRLEPPTVNPVVPVIRSGDQMLFRQPGQDFLSVEQRERLWHRQDPGESADGARPPKYSAEKTVILGDIVVEFGFDSIDERYLQSFLDFFEDQLASKAIDVPNGIRYRGTYAVYSSSEKTSGKYRTMWSFKGKKALDRMTAETESIPEEDDRGAMGVTEFGAFVRRLRGLADTRPGANRSQNWYQPAWGFRK